MNGVIEVAIGEALKLAIQQVVILANSANKTPEQVQAELDAEWIRFQTNKPENLPDV